MPANADWQFHDDLLDHLAGKWIATGIIHGNAATLNVEAEWILEHKYLRFQERGGDNVPGQPFPFEGVMFFGYDPTAKRYIAHQMTVWGGNDPRKDCSMGFARERNQAGRQDEFRGGESAAVHVESWH